MCVLSCIQSLNTPLLIQNQIRYKEKKSSHIEPAARMSTGDHLRKECISSAAGGVTDFANVSLMWSIAPVDIKTFKSSCSLEAEVSLVT